MINVQSRGADTRATLPAPPVHTDPAVARFLAAQTAVHAALEAQRAAIAALRALDSQFPAMGGVL